MAGILKIFSTIQELDSFQEEVSICSMRPRAAMVVSSAGFFYWRLLNPLRSHGKLTASSLSAPFILFKAVLMNTMPKTCSSATRPRRRRSPKPKEGRRKIFRWLIQVLTGLSSIHNFGVPHGRLYQLLCTVNLDEVQKVRSPPDGSP